MQGDECGRDGDEDTGVPGERDRLAGQEFDAHDAAGSRFLREGGFHAVRGRRIGGVVDTV
ncbi:MAG: hypothetical protein GC151_15310 [Betaproteobacteria bacterium]|nr:hypothetical protein [Betaproteobacteria bacterium]